MSTLHNHVSNNNNSSNLNNNIGSSSNQQSSPQAAGSFLLGTTGSPSCNNNHQHHPHYHQHRSVGHPSDSNSSNIVNNNNNPTTTTTTTTTSTATGGGGGVVGGILGGREVSAKKFLPSFARSMMMSSSSSSAAQHHHHHHQQHQQQQQSVDSSNTSGAGGWMGSMDSFNSATPLLSATGTTVASTSGSSSTAAAAAASSTVGAATGGAGTAGPPGRSSFPIPDVLNVVLHGYQRKLKTNKKKYFVVYGDTPDKFARLEYFDSEKKFKQSFAKLLGGLGGSSGGSDGPVAKRSIVLRSCFNINKRHDTKKHIIALFTKDDCFCIVFESEDELNRWLRTLLRLQRGEESEGDPPRPKFEHVWDVLVQPKGLGDSYGILGSYRLCITDKILSLVRIGLEVTATQEKRADVVEFSLASIRRCGHSQRYFYLEVGRSSKTGAGEIWMEVQDSFIAQNMYTTIMKSAKNKDDNLGPMIRIRSSSANAASKPTSMLFRRQTHAGQKPMNCSPSSGVAIARERCDSLPSRNRTTSETMPHQQQQQQHQQQHQQQLHQQQLQQHQLMLNSGGMPPPRMIPSNNRPHSMHISSCHGHSPPVNSSPLSPPPATYSTGSDGSSYSIDESTDSFITDPPTPDEGNGYKVINHLNSGGSIPEENSEEFIKDYGHIDLRLGGGLSQHDEYGSGAQTHFRMSPQSDGKPSNYTSYPQNHHHTSTINARLGHHHNSLSLPISQAARRGGSPAPPSTVGSVEGSAYMEMCSPSGSSPGDPSGSCYMAMSPVADYSRGLCSSSSAHSRASSLAEDLVDGYVPMNMSRTVTTQPPPEEYVIMDPTQNGTSSRLSNATSGGGGGGNGMAGGIGGMSSAASSCSITSGTPSTDLRLSLEKVPAYIGQSDEGEVNDRPYRTYSVGSRPEHIKRKLRIDMLSSAEGGLGGGGGGAGGGSASSRQRAFSVGSRAKVPRCSEMYKGYSQAPIIVSFVSSSSQGSVTESNNNSGGSTSSIPHVGSFGGGVSDTLPNLPLDESAMGGKSGSGSLLVEWKPPLGSGGPANHGSVDHMADLMEIDYSSPRQPGADEATGHNSSSTPLKKPGAAVIPGMEDYLDMSGSGNAGYGDSPSNNYNSHALKDLFEDKEHPVLPPALSMEGDYLNMTPGSSGRGGHVGEDVVDGSHGGGSSKSTSNPIQISSPKKYGGIEGNSAGKNNNYLDMYPRMQQVKTATGSGPSAGGSGAVPATKVPSEDYLNMTPLMMMSSAEKSGSEEKMLGSVSSGSAPEGYMEMSFNHSTTANSNNVPSAMVPLAEDYMNMTAGTAPSAPITIQPIAGKCRLDLSGESKVEASANIPNYLPLGHHHHNPHHHHATGEAARKTAQAATTIVSLQQPVQTTTGQQSGSIGFSPSKGGGSGGAGGLVLRARCDSRDSGIMTPSGSQATIFPFSPGSPTQSFPDGSSSGETSAKQQPAGTGMETLEDLSQNYAELSLGRQQQIPGPLPGEAAATMTPLARKLSTGSRSSGTFGRAGTLASPGVVQPDYVNFCPVAPTTPTSEMPATQQQQPQTTARSRVEDDGAGDYALMNPASARKQSTTSMGGGSVVGAGSSPSASSSSVASSSSPPVLVAKKSTFLSNPLMGFKPIASTQDAELLAQGPPAKVLNCTASSPKATFSRRLDGVSTAFSFDQSAQPPLQRSFSGTRPNSVNSELITGRGAVAVIGGAAGGTSTPTSTGGGGTTRPNSANSERLPIISATSSSASSTSTLCESKNQSPSASCTAIAGSSSSSSTVVESRPDSVSSVTDPHFISRPPSVSSERELHYASLDLPPCSKTTAAAAGAAAATVGLVPAASPLVSSALSSALLVQKMDVDEPYDVLSTSSPSPGCTSQQPQQPVRCGGASTYAQIDFLRSQAPKQQSAASPAGPSPSAGSGTGGSGAPQSSQA